MPSRKEFRGGKSESRNDSYSLEAAANKLCPVVLRGAVMLCFLLLQGRRTERVAQCPFRERPFIPKKIFPRCCCLKFLDGKFADRSCRAVQSFCEYSGSRWNSCSICISWSRTIIRRCAAREKDYSRLDAFVSVINEPSARREENRTEESFV